MRYLIITDIVFYTKYYDYENNYCEGMIVVDTFKYKYTKDGINWMDVELDHL
jgi:hypothetical protein